MNDVEAFAQLTKMMISTIEGLAKMVPRWRDPVERKTGRCRELLSGRGVLPKGRDDQLVTLLASIHSSGQTISPSK